MTTITTPLVPFFYEGRFLRKKLYNIIQTPVGKPDLDTIILLEEIVDKYRLFTDKNTKQKRAKFKGDIWQVAYKYFEGIYGKCHDTIRESLKKLEELGFIERIIKTIVLNGKLIPNALHIKLNISRLYSFFYPRLYPENSGENSNNNLPSSIKKKEEDYINSNINININGNFSKKSSLEGSDFSKNSFNLEPGLTSTAENTDRGCPNTVLANKKEVPPPVGESNQKLGWGDFLPLSKERSLELEQRSGKSGKVINLILTEISQKDGYKDYPFDSQQHFINRATMFLIKEKRTEEQLNKVLEEKAQKQEALVNPSAANTFIKEEKMPEMLESAIRISSYNIAMNYFTKKDKAIEPLKDGLEKGNYTREEGSVTNHTNGIEPGVPPISEDAVERRLVSVFEPGKAPGDKIIRDISKELQKALGHYPKYEARFQYLEEAKVNEEERLVLLKMKHRGAAFVMDRDFRDPLDSFFQGKGYAYKLLFRQEDGEYGIYYESWWSWKPSEFYP